MSGEQDDHDALARGDEAPAGTDGAGEDVCPACDGAGERGGGPCPECGGAGTVVRGVGGG